MLISRSYVEKVYDYGKRSKNNNCNGLLVRGIMIQWGLIRVDSGGEASLLLHHMYVNICKAERLLDNSYYYTGHQCGNTLHRSPVRYAQGMQDHHNLHTSKHT